MKRPARRNRSRTLKQLIRRNAFWLPVTCAFFASIDLAVIGLEPGAV